MGGGEAGIEALLACGDCPCGVGELLDEFGVEEVGEGGLDIGSRLALVRAEPFKFAESVEVFVGEDGGSEVEALFFALFGSVCAD
jgi:hypothetical protein